MKYLYIYFGFSYNETVEAHDSGTLYVFQEDCICVVYKYLQVKQDNIKLPRRYSYMHQTSTEKDENILDTENLNVTIKFSHQPTNKYNEKNISQTKVDQNYSDILDIELGNQYKRLCSQIWCRFIFREDSEVSKTLWEYYI